MRRSTEPPILLALAALALLVSRIGAADVATWWMEVAPFLIVAPILVGTHRRFPLTPLLYRLIFSHALILFVGGHYTYAEVPAGFWARDALGLSRNHFDRLGHLFQGITPALATREVLLGTSPLKRGKWLFFLSLCVPLAASAFYEMIEWWAAVFTADGAVAFLGSQGDVWDAQWDMFLCLIGAALALLALAGAQDRQLGEHREQAPI